MSTFLLVAVQKRNFGSMTRKAVASALADHARKDGTGIYPSKTRVAAMVGCSEKTAVREIRALLKMGVLRLVRKGGRGPRDCNEYAFDLHALEALPHFKSRLVADDISIDNNDAFAGSDRASAMGEIRPNNDFKKGRHHDPHCGHKGDIGDQKEGQCVPQTCKEPDKPQTPTAAWTVETVDFEEFEIVWPWTADERRDAAKAAWSCLDGTNRRSAIDYVQSYLAACRAGKARREKSRLQAEGYLRSRMWRKGKPVNTEPRRRVNVIHGTVAWDWASRKRSQKTGYRMVGSQAREKDHPETGEMVRAADIKSDWFDGEDLPPEIKAAEGRDWWRSD